MLSVRVNVDAVRQAMKTVGERGSRTIFRASLRQHAHRFRRLMMPHVPVLKSKQTLGGGSQGREPGQLRRAIAVTEYGGRGRLGFGVFVQSRSVLGVAKDSRWYYPAHLHYGHTFKRSDGGQIIRRLPSTPRYNSRGKRSRSLWSVVKKYWKRPGRLFGFKKPRKARTPKPFDWILRVNRFGYFTRGSQNKLKDLEARGLVYRKVKPRPYMKTPAKAHGDTLARSMATEIANWITRYAMKVIANG